MAVPEAAFSLMVLALRDRAVGASLVLLTDALKYTCAESLVPSLTLQLKLTGPPTCVCVGAMVSFLLPLSTVT